MTRGSPRRRTRPASRSAVAERVAAPREPAAPAARAAGARARAAAAAAARPPRSRDRKRGGEDRQQRRQRRAEAGEHQHAEHRHRDEVRRALEREERDRALGDLVRRHPALAQRPRAERQPARAAGGNERPDRELRQPELGRGPPGHPLAEDRLEHHDVGQRTTAPRAPRPARASPGRAAASRSRTSPRPGASAATSPSTTRSADRLQRPAPQQSRVDLVLDRLRRLQVFDVQLLHAQSVFHAPGVARLGIDSARVGPATWGRQRGRPAADGHPPPARATSCSG